MSGKNQIQDIRPDCTFANYVAQNENQTSAAQHLQSLTQLLVDNRGMFASASTSRSFGAAARSSPFPNGMIVFIHGTPGTGKTHLVEAVVNKLKSEAPEVLDDVFFYRGELQYPILDGSDNLHLDYGHKSIIMLDDLYANKQSLNHADSADYKRISAFLTMVYEKRCLVIVSSNFSMADEMVPFIKKHDQIGRLSSRVEELMGGRGFSIDTSGPDYRVKIAAEMKKTQAPGQLNPFALLKP